jgi:two-component system sensor histidine kinase UhpB
VKDATGLPLTLPAGASAREPVHEAQAPKWFTALIAPEVESRHVPVVVKGQRIGSVEIVAEPSDEIAEVWTNSAALGAVALLVNVAVIAMLYFLFGRVLDPLAGVAHGLGDLEQRNYGVRLTRPQARELAVITDRFNALAHALDAARSENDQLNRRLISAQDDERRNTARELHDEFGPCLFGLKVNAGSIETAAAALPDRVGGRLLDRARDMLAIIEQLQAVNRRLLNRLRPMALGHFPLRDVLAGLVSENAQRDPAIAFTLKVDALERSYGDSIDLTIYRCLQESLTNIVRHARARDVRIELAEGKDTLELETGARCLHLAVQDDGCGFDRAAVPTGFGIRGMQERVHGLGGRFVLESGRGRGTSVRIVVPLPPGQDHG